MRTVSKATRKKMSLAAKHRCTKEWRKTKSKAYSTKIDLVHLEELYNNGLTQSEIALILDVSQKVIWGAMKRNNIKARKAKKRNQSGENNDNWKGDDAGYSALHYRKEQISGKPQKCEVCGTDDPAKAYHWASLTKKYNDPADYKRMCHSCHAKNDGVIANINKAQNRGDA